MTAEVCYGDDRAFQVDGTLLDERCIFQYPVKDIEFTDGYFIGSGARFDTAVVRLLSVD
jgi:hypothetical protein